MLLPRMASRRRPGLSLLEVLLALAIFLLSIVALWHLVGQATLNAERAYHTSQAARIAQSKMHLVLAGRYFQNGPPEAQGSMPADDDDSGIEDDGELHSYNWSIVMPDSDSVTLPQNVYQIEIHVTRTLSNGDQVEAVLSQFVYDPTQLGTVQDGLLPLNSQNTPSNGYTVPGGPYGSTTGTGTTGSSTTGGM
jgi:general secretion pathway protein I